jgi:hypothetical protein
MVAMLLKHWRALSKYERALIILFIATLLLVNPSVRGDGVGYYAYLRSLLIDGDLQFADEMVAGGLVRPGETAVRTATGYTGNGWPVGSAILWAPFVSVTHLVVLALDKLGAHVPADGYAWPYALTVALSSAVYGFCGLYLAFRLARLYFAERWAFLSTLGIWFASPLPVYMYFNPGYSHALSAFMTAVFLWYWHRTRDARTLAQWTLLGLISGLMLDVYYPNAVFLLLPCAESLKRYWRAWRAPWRDSDALRRLATANLLYLAVTLAAFLPTLVTRYILYGSPLESGHVPVRSYRWASPALGDVLFSANHGLLSWTPILLPAVLGLLKLRRRAPELAAYLGLVFLAFYYLIAAYPYWHGASSFGNRFFVSLTPVFVLGLAGALELLDALRNSKLGVPSAAAGIALLSAWNVGLVIQWGTALVPDQGPVSWRKVAYNQTIVVARRRW